MEIYKAFLLQQVGFFHHALKGGPTPIPNSKFQICFCTFSYYVYSVV